MGKAKKGDYIFVNNSDGSKFLRKLIFIGEKTFEFNYGWGKTSQIKPNSKKSSKVKFEFDNF